MGTYVVSDVHGHLADLRAVLTRAGLLRDDRWVGGPDGDDELWILGDLVDRGPDGIGVVRLVRSLQEQAPQQVHMLMGNHESLMLGERLFPSSRFEEVWLMNGGRLQDQEGLGDDDIAWLRALPAMAVAGENLLLHSDTTNYLSWGRSVEDVNATLAGLLAGDDAAQHFDVFAALTSRYDYVGEGGVDTARRMLETFGGRRVVHGQSIIGTLVDKPSYEIDGPLVYAEGLVVAIDGGRYDGGPLLLVRLD
jgi:hypothetical protein